MKQFGMAVDSSLFDPFLIIVLVVFSMVVFVQKLGLVLAGFVPDPRTGFRGWAFSPLIPLAVSRDPVVAYGHQEFLVQIALSGIRHDFSGYTPANSTLLDFAPNLRVRPYVVDHWHNEH
jgi:hypothetical protein